MKLNILINKIAFTIIIPIFFINCGTQKKILSNNSDSGDVKPDNKPDDKPVTQNTVSLNLLSDNNFIGAAENIGVITNNYELSTSSETVSNFTFDLSSIPKEFTIKDSNNCTKILQLSTQAPCDFSISYKPGLKTDQNKEIVLNYSFTDSSKKIINQSLVLIPANSLSVLTTQQPLNNNVFQISDEYFEFIINSNLYYGNSNEGIKQFNLKKTTQAKTILTSDSPNFIINNFNFSNNATNFTLCSTDANDNCNKYYFFDGNKIQSIPNQNLTQPIIFQNNTPIALDTSYYFYTFKNNLSNPIPITNMSDADKNSIIFGFDIDNSDPNITYIINSQQNHYSDLQYCKINLNSLNKPTFDRENCKASSIKDLDTSAFEKIIGNNGKLAVFIRNPTNKNLSIYFTDFTNEKVTGPVATTKNIINYALDKTNNIIYFQTDPKFLNILDLNNGTFQSIDLKIILGTKNISYSQPFLTKSNNVVVVGSDGIVYPLQSSRDSKGTVTLTAYAFNNGDHSYKLTIPEGEKIQENRTTSNKDNSTPMLTTFTDKSIINFNLNW